jgi:DNA-binding MarR family transcriptional regulator
MDDEFLKHRVRLIHDLADKADVFTKRRLTDLARTVPGFIYTYSHMFRRPPAETDMLRHFQVSPPSVHQMIVTLERNGLIRRQPGLARSIQILVAPKELPILDSLKIYQS